jgi:hypothetical protein
MASKKPVYVQRSRKTRQFSRNGLPIKYVGRPSPFGNPFRQVKDIVYIDASLNRKILDKWVFFCFASEHTALELYKMLVQDALPQTYLVKKSVLEHWRNHFFELNYEELRGYNLSCWCKSVECCHVGIIFDMLYPKKQNQK